MLNNEKNQLRNDLEEINRRNRKANKISRQLKESKCNKQNTNINVLMQNQLKDIDNQKCSGQLFNIKLSDVSNLSMASPYISQITAYLISRQDNYLTYIRQNKMNYRHQIILYIVKIHWVLKLKNVTLHLCVYYLDHYLSNLQQYPSNDQLVLIANTVILIAMKYEEIYPIPFRKWSKMRLNASVKKKQSEILNKLNYKLNFYSCQHFFEHFSAVVNLSINQYRMCEKLIFLTLFDSIIRRYAPAQIVKNIILLVVEETSILTNYQITYHLKELVIQNPSLLQMISAHQQEMISNS